MIQQAATTALVLGALVGLIVMSSAQAQPAADNNTVTVQDLYQKCRAAAVEKAFEQGVCAGYVGGVGDMLAYTGRCPAMIGATYGAMVQAFENWAPAHPRDWTKQQAEGVVAALFSAWSCGKSP
jgi:hypothetical protein